MTFVAQKTLLALLLLAAAVVALLAMLALMGKTERRARPETLRAVHRTAGYAFAVFLLALVARGGGMLALMGDEIPTRAVLHIVLAAGIVVLLAFKILFARAYRQFLKHAPALGLTLFALAFVAVAISAGFALVTRGTSAAPHPEPMTDARAGGSAAADAGLGELLFEQHCASCHDADARESTVGPGLEGLWSRSTLTAGGEPVTDESVSRQIVNPRGSMPSFASTLDEQDLADLLAYLRTL